MAVTQDRPHFVQHCDGPVFLAAGTGSLSCACGRLLIQGYAPEQFLSIAIQCGDCAAVTETPSLAEGRSAPAAIVVAEASAEPCIEPITLAANTAIVGEAERDRLAGLYAPQTPSSNTYSFDAAFLDETAAQFAELTGDALPSVQTEIKNGLGRHALAWSVEHLRQRIAAGDWACLDSTETSIASLTVAAFRHFTATWSQHLMFPAMLATAADAGFSTHGLAQFAAAHCLVMQRNRIGFPPVLGYPGRVDHLLLGSGPRDWVPVYTRVFDRFELPWGRPWDHAAVRAAVEQAMAAEAARINPKNPGLLLLSPGAVPGGFDEALVPAVQAAMLALGRRYRGLMAVAPVLLRLFPARTPHAVQYGYGLFPSVNRHYRGDTLLMQS